MFPKQISDAIPSTKLGLGTTVTAIGVRTLLQPPTAKLSITHKLVLFCKLFNAKILPVPSNCPPTAALNQYNCPKAVELALRVIFSPRQTGLGVFKTGVGIVLSSALPLQFSSIPLHFISVATGLILAALSLQSPETAIKPTGALGEQTITRLVLLP